MFILFIYLFIYLLVMGPMGSYHFLSRCSRQSVCWYFREGRTHQPMQLCSRALLPTPWVWSESGASWE